MKTYILRDPKAVEPQNRKRNPTNRLPNPVWDDPAALPPGLSCRILHVGLDVHNDTIAVSLAPSNSTEVWRYGLIGGQHEDVFKLLQKLATTHPGSALKCCYAEGSGQYQELRSTPFRFRGTDWRGKCVRESGHRVGARPAIDRDPLI